MSDNKNQIDTNTKYNPLSTFEKSRYSDDGDPSSDILEVDCDVDDNNDDEIEVKRFFERSTKTG